MAAESEKFENVFKSLKKRESPALKVICWIFSSRDPNGDRLKKHPENPYEEISKSCCNCDRWGAGTPLELQPAAADHGRSRPVSGMP